MSATVIIILVCALMCPVVMGVMMLFMRNRHGESARERADRPGEVSDE